MSASSSRQIDPLKAGVWKETVGKTKQSKTTAKSFITFSWELGGGSDTVL